MADNNTGERCRCTMIISDVEIRLFIGYNCPRVLTPRKVIAVSEDGLYAQRTDIG